MSSAPVLEFRDVSFAYEQVPVLEGATFSLAAGESVSIIGPNGGGKTTLVRLALGILRPQRGEIRVFSEPPERSRLRIGYMPQHSHFDPQFPITALEIVLMGRLGGRGWRAALGWYGGEDRRIALAAMEEVGVAHLARRAFATLSGGQRQRVLIARALCCRPELMILDEPTASVDSQGEAQLVEILHRLSRRMTIATVTHDLGFVSQLAEKALCVNRRVAVHPTREVTGRVIQELYGGDMRLVAHEQCLVPQEPARG